MTDCRGSAGIGLEIPKCLGQGGLHSFIKIISLDPDGLDAEKTCCGAIDRSPEKEKKQQEEQHNRQRIAATAAG